MKANPSAPAVLGLEWPPVFGRLIPLDSGTERGHVFTSGATPEVVSQIDPYLGAPEASSYAFQVVGNIYKKADVGAYGAVKKVVALCNGGAVSGVASLSGAATVQLALQESSDLGSVSFPAGVGSVRMTFATSAGQLPEIVGKRILHIGLYYDLYCVLDPIAEGFAFPTLVAGIGRVPIEGSATALKWGAVRGDFAPFPVATQIRYINLGEINPCSPTGSGTANTTDRWPWSVADIQSFAVGDGAGMELSLSSVVGHVVQFQLSYAALEITYCEENRQAFAGKRMSESLGSETASTGYHVLNVRTPGGGTALNTFVKQPATDYVATMKLADSGGPFLNPDVAAGVYGAIPQIATLDSFGVFAPHAGRELPLGTDNQVTLVADISRITPMYLSVTGVAGLSVDTEPYVVQVNAPVSVAASATQEIAQRAAAVATPYPWIRFYARRFGNSTSLSVTIGGQTASITAAAFDALPEIINGWRLVTLRFATAPLISNTGVNTNAVFTSADALINRWEILGATDGLAGTATYEGPTSAATISGTRNATVDLAVNIATAAPAVSGFNATQQTLPVTGVGLLCGGDPPCIPTGVGYVQLSWTPTVITGFGYYEVQRADTDETVARTIAKVTNQATPNFADFEARIGLESLYQIRVVRADGIQGDWGPTGTGLPFLLSGDAINTPPGVLIFTSNVAPTGSIGFVDAFEQTPAEEFLFPETDTRVLQRIHGRDFQTAFRPTERGGTAFDRTLLVGNTLNFQPAFTSQRGFQPNNFISFVSSIFNTGFGPLFSLPDPPPGTVPGDTMLAFIAAFAGGVVTTPIGWTLLQHVGNLWVYSKVARPLDPVTVWQSSNITESWLGACVSYRGVLQAIPVDTSSGAAGTTTAPSVTTANPNDELVYGGISAGPAGTPFIWTPPAGMTERVDFFQGASSIEVSDALMSAAGPTGTRTATPVGTGPFTGQACALVALTAAAAVSGAPPATGSSSAPVIGSGITADDAFDALRDLAWNPNIPYVCVRDDLGNRWLANVVVPSGIVKRRRGIFLAHIHVTETTATPSQGDRAF